MAMTLRQLPKGCIHHTDRGSQYCLNDCQKLLIKHGFKVSMSGKGNCYDNSMVETFFKSIKAELIWRNRWETRRQAEGAIFQYINGFYNPRRRHPSLGGKSPLGIRTKGRINKFRDQNASATRPSCGCLCDCPVGILF